MKLHSYAGDTMHTCHANAQLIIKFFGTTWNVFIFLKWPRKTPATIDIGKNDICKERVWLSLSNGA